MIISLLSWLSHVYYIISFLSHFGIIIHNYIDIAFFHNLASFFNWLINKLLINIIIASYLVISTYYLSIISIIFHQITRSLARLVACESEIYSRAVRVINAVVIYARIWHHGVHQVTGVGVLVTAEKKKKNKTSWLSWFAQQSEGL